MNVVANELVAPAIAEDHKHYIFTIDPDTGEEVKVEVLPLEGEFSQETEGDEVTLH